MPTEKNKPLTITFDNGKVMQLELVDHIVDGSHKEKYTGLKMKFGRVCVMASFLMRSSFLHCQDLYNWQITEKEGSNIFLSSAMLNLEYHTAKGICDWMETNSNELTQICKRIYDGEDIKAHKKYSSQFGAELIFELCPFLEDMRNNLKNEIETMCQKTKFNY